MPIVPGALVGKVVVWVHPRDIRVFQSMVLEFGKLALIH
jgi:hypothetical protein